MIDTLLVLLALGGHAFLWIGFINRTHSIALPRSLKWSATIAGFGALGIIPLAFGVWFTVGGVAVVSRGGWFQIPAPLALYMALCWAGAAGAVVRGLMRLLWNQPPEVLRYHRTRLMDLFVPTPRPDPDTEDEHHFLVRLPGNEILQLDIAERALEIATLPDVLDRLTIIHLSDLHFTGRVGKRYFEEVVRLSNLFEPDLIALTGDLVDTDDCISWIPDTLGKLSARYGVYFILGNHDLRCNVKRLRATLTDCGLIDLGGRWVERDIRGERVILAGNELPWIPPAANLSEAPARDDQGRPIRILLSHTPDQLAWAQAHDVDLMLAGHLHGGQIRLPILGPIFSPSRRGGTYACGTFYLSPTVMHVTRGVSAEIPVRMNCPPEMAKLVLHTASGMAERLL